MSTPIQDHPGFDQIERLLSGGMPSRATADLLTSLGFIDQERAARSLQTLALHPSFPREDTNFLLQFLESIGETFEPGRALTNLERILESRENPDALLSALRRSSERRAVVLTLAGGSQFLSDTLLRHPKYLDWILRPSTLHGNRSKQKMFSELWRWVRAAMGEPNGPANAMRRFRQREYLRIGVLDLLRWASTEETTLALSNLADITLEAALRVSQSELHTLYGKPRWRSLVSGRLPCEFAVIGMGKLGGQELNFSSDIDLLFIYSSDEGGTTGVRDPYAGKRKGQISNHDFNVHLAQKVIQLMAENTEEGHIFRVDLRLRPEGTQGDLAYSLRSCEVYYESWGETWERQAMIKARLCAGSEPLGQAFHRMIRPFIYRQTLDLSALDEIGKIKDRINSKLVASGREHLNIKLGEGGIREIEFIIQSFQLIYGGKESLLRMANSLQALSAIKELGLLPINDCEGLAEAYIFLRDIEHRVQMIHGLQTHDLPADTHGLTILARKMGFRVDSHDSEKDTFKEELRKHQDHVGKIFESLFRREDSQPETAPKTSAPTAPASAETLEDSLSPSDLAPYNFADPDSASARLRLLRNGEPFQHISARAKRSFDELLPRMLYFTLALPDPDQAVANLCRFVEKGGGREAVFTLLAESARMFESLLKLFGSSNYLSDILIQQPAVFDTIIQAGVLIESKSRESLYSDIHSSIQNISSMVKRFNALAIAKRGEEFIIGMRSILGESDIIETLTDLTNLADVVVEIGLSIAEEEMRSRHGEPGTSKETAGFAIIGMGKLGSGEMNFGSDLDLIFAYGVTSKKSSRLAREKKSSRGVISPHDFYLKLATALRDGLTGPEAGERSYDIDLRLRPEGQKGRLVIPIEQFKTYLDGRAESWEKQALCRARHIAGSKEIGDQFMALSSEFVYESPLLKNFAGEVDHMRHRMERELARESEGNVDIKLGMGGIADIDFIVQFLQITRGRDNPSLRRPDSFGAIQAFHEAGLLSETQKTTLSKSYRFLRLVENRLRIANSQSLHTLPKSPEEMEILARRIGYEDDEDGSSRAKLLSDYEKHTHQVRVIYRKIMSGVDAERPLK